MLFDHGRGEGGKKPADPYFYRKEQSGGPLNRKGRKHARRIIVESRKKIGRQSK